MIARLLLLAALLALSALVLDLHREEDERLGPPGALEPPRYYLRDATVSEFDRDGALRYELTAARAIEDPDRDLVLLESVAIDYRRRPDQTWRVTAARGELRRGAAIVELEGDVELTGRGERLPRPAVLRSPRLSLDTEAEVASTDAPVELDFGRHALRARGLRADLKAETLRLESSVNGRFFP